MKISKAKETNEKLSTITTKKLPIKMSFAIQKNAKRIKEIVDFANERQNDIIERCAERDEKGNFVPSEDDQGIKIADAETFMKEMTELMETDMDIDLVKISMADVERCDEERYDSLTPNDLDAIEDMIIEG